MNINITPENYHNLRLLINYSLFMISDEDLNDSILNSATWFNSLQIACPELDNGKDK